LNNSGSSASAVQSLPRITVLSSMRDWSLTSENLEKQIIQKSPFYYIT